MNITQPDIEIEQIYQRMNTTPKQIAHVCQKWQIVELSVFGSVLRDDFRVAGNDPSDIDLLYVFADGTNHSLFDIMYLQEELEKLFHRKVDFVSRIAIEKSRNWLRRQEILKSGSVIYVQR